MRLHIHKFKGPFSLHIFKFTVDVYGKMDNKEKAAADSLFKHQSQLSLPSRHTMLSQRCVSAWLFFFKMEEKNG